MLLGLPLSIHKKSYWPVTLAAAAGTAADFKEVSEIQRTAALDKFVQHFLLPFLLKNIDTTVGAVNGRA